MRFLYMHRHSLLKCCCESSCTFRTGLLSILDKDWHHYRKLMEQCVICFTFKTMYTYSHAWPVDKELRIVLGTLCTQFFGITNTINIWEHSTVSLSSILSLLSGSWLLENPGESTSSLFMDKHWTDTFRAVLTHSEVQWWLFSQSVHPFPSLCLFG